MVTLAINICSPKNEDWGDAIFAKNLAFEFNLLGITTKIIYPEDWYKTNEFEKTLTISGKFIYKPNPKKKNYLWIISHPEIRNVDELNSFEHVFVASKFFQNMIKKDISVTSSILNQATNFSNQENNSHDLYDLLFIGNNYYDNFPARKIIYDLNDEHRKILKVIGKNWSKFLPKENIISDFVDYSKLPKMYCRSKIVLNDHHEFMRRFGFINNRTFDLAALNQFQISDKVIGLEDFGVEYYENRNDLNDKIDFYLNHENERKRNAIITNKLCQNNTFKNVAKKIAEKL